MTAPRRASDLHAGSSSTTLPRYLIAFDAEPKGVVANRRQRLLLKAAKSDRTFERKEHNGLLVLEGKCIHCRRKLAIHLDGTPISDATLEHIIPKHHGGTDEVDNLAVACARCNSEKGLRHDHKDSDDPKLQQIIGALQARKRKRKVGR